MQHSVLDRIYVAFLVILVTSFVILILFTSYFMRRSLISEKSRTLIDDASLIASQAVSGYLTDRVTDADLERSLSYYGSTLDADIFYIGEDGQVIARSVDHSWASSTDTEIRRTRTFPSSIYTLDGKYPLHRTVRRTDSFYGLYSTDMLSVNVPVLFRNTKAGALLLLTPVSDINNMMRSVYSISYLPCLVIIAISFIFLAIVSRRILQPIRKLSSVAEEYSTGNFDARTGIHSKDEIGQLASSMEYMAGELSKLDEYRKDFVSNISHDFRSPLTSISGYVQAMLDGTIPTENQEKYLKIIQNETKRLTKLTNGLLDLDHLESYGPYLKLSSFDFIDIIKSTLSTFELRCVEKNVAIYLNNHAQNTIVTADKQKIQQVVYNLIDNAIKFTPSGKKIYVTITEKDEKLSVSIRDEGIGMNEDTQKKIWTRFYKGDTSRGKDKNGSGLGLAITREIIRAHHETIEVSSREGSGSEFTFTLTKASAGADVPLSPGSENPAGGGPHTEQLTQNLKG